MPTAPKPKPKAAAYKVLTGLNYPPERRANVGAAVDDIPKESVPWLLRAGHIEATDEKVTGSVNPDQTED